ncbi:MAG: hypothetical protein SF172_08480 [Burkholderiales bacterium]|nr:hypothetical protein [Burkholderiales bacterium]
MNPVRAFLIRLFRQWPAVSLAALVAVILIHEAPRGAADYEPLSLRPYAQATQPSQAEPGYAALSHPPMPAAGA